MSAISFASAFVLVAVFTRTPCSPLRAQEAGSGEVLKVLQEKEAEKEGDGKEAGTAPAAEEPAAPASEPGAEEKKEEKAGEAKETEKKEAEAKEAAAKEAAAKEAAAKEAAAKEGAAREAAARAAIAKVRAAPAVQELDIEVAAPAVTAPAEESAAASGEAPPEAGADAEGAAPSGPPAPPMFWMRDGTRLAGLPRIDELHVETAYGELVVPVSEITRVRFAEQKDTSFVDRLLQLIDQLGHEEFDLREEAMEEIRKIGSPAVETLTKALETTDDEEVRTRLEKLIEELFEEEEEPDEEEIHKVPLKGDEDEVVTFEFTVRGKVRESEFFVETRYGELTFRRDDIISVVFRAPLVTEKKFTVGQANTAGQNAWLDTGVALADGTSYEVAASGQITLRTNGQACGAEGTSNAPARFESFPAGALVGRIGTGGKAFLLGASYDGQADQAGNLFLAIALQNQNELQGQFEVTVRKKNE